MYGKGMSIPLKRQGPGAVKLYDLLVTLAPLELDPSAATSLADKAYVAIRDRLIMLAIRPGDPIDDDEPAPAQASAQQAFWALAPVERDVVDENGAPLFRIGPTAWALVIEDRGDSFVVRHEDGRIGYLTDVSGVTRG